MPSHGFRNLTPVAAVLALLLLAACGGSVGDGVSGPTVLDRPADPSPLRAADVQLDDLDLDGLELAEGEVVWSAGDPDGLSGSCRGKVLLCHKGRMSLWVPAWAVKGHKRHGDTLGRCGGSPPPAASCPCFTAADIEAEAAGCSSVNASCPAPYSLGLFCAPGGSSGTVGNIGYWEAVVGQGTCSRTVWDPLTGDSSTETHPVDADQSEACRTAITSSAPYPSSCPQ